MSRRFRTRFWVEAGLATLTAVSALVTQLWPNWIELVFRADPDHGNGSLERVLVGVCLVAFLANITLAGAEHRRHQAQSA
ncbi:MAG TPA: hypothetical protein VMV09_07985 [Candidatus Saccharimonadales bacterium]|nr:hypothetical protein [Candidatus Saccharimonadales bacterium]